MVLFFPKLPAQNPILKNITDYLIEEVSAEEEELLGSGSGIDEEGTKEGNPAEMTVERDDKLAKVITFSVMNLQVEHFPVKKKYTHVNEYKNHV